MCRLYGFRASHPSRLDCDLVEAQNALVQQSRGDAQGDRHPDGWGLGLLRDGRVTRRREAAPAYESELYGPDVREACAETVLAHVRKATVGGPARENTHPFRHGDALLIHNGEIGGFDRMRGRMREATAPRFRRSLEGSTDTEHFFHLLLTRWDELGGEPRDPDPPCMRRALDAAVGDVLRWRRELAEAGEPEARVSLNVLWAVGGVLAGTRLGRSLWYVERDGPHRCGTCGGPHPESAPGNYRAVIFASERISDEDWSPVPPGSVFSVADDLTVTMAPLEGRAAA